MSFYVCGPTVYDVAHLGHGRTAVVFDTMRRYLEWSGYAVTFVSNVTDVDDRIIAKAAAEGTTEPEIAARYSASYWADIERLGCRRPDEVPHATEFIDRMQGLIAELVASGHAYVIEGRGGVLRGGELSRLRRALAPPARRPPRGGRCASRGRRAEAEPGRLRALEGGEAG